MLILDNIIYKHILHDKSDTNKFFMKNNVGIIYHLYQSPVKRMDLSKSLVSNAGVTFKPLMLLSAVFTSLFVKYYISFMDYLNQSNSFLHDLLNIETPPFLFLYSDGNNPTPDETSFIMEKLATNPDTHIKLIVYKYLNEYEDQVYLHLKHCKCDITQFVQEKPNALVDDNNNIVKKGGIMKLFDSIFA